MPELGGQGPLLAKPDDMEGCFEEAL